MPTSSSTEAATALWSLTDLSSSSLSHLKWSGDPDSAINSSFKLGVATQVSIGVAGLAAAELYRLRTGITQDVVVDARHALVHSHSEAFYTIDKQPPPGIWDSIAGLYKTMNSGFVRIHTNFPHHRRGILSILHLTDSPHLTRDEVAGALLKWDAVDFETEAASRGMCATAMRSFAQWDQHPQAKALVGTPPVSLTRIGDAPKRLPTKDPSRPLDGIRVLDLSRVLAGPVAGRTLAAYGADVLLVTSPNLPALPVLDVDTSLGKRTTQLDLGQHSDKEILRRLCKESDVFLQAYRPGGLNDKGFGIHELAKLRPGIICANLTAWGWDGPWKDRRGFDSLVQTATGFNVAEDEAYREFCKVERHLAPKPFPLQALDHAAGYLLAYGINAALCKSMTEGGSWEVRVSLAAVGQWVRSLGRLSPEEAFGKGRPFPQPLDPEVVALSTDWPPDNNDTTTRLGVHEITAIKHAAVLSKTPAKEGRYSQAPMVLNAHPPSWLP